MLAVRSLLRTPAFTAVALATLALCIGANSAIFSVVNAIILKPYPWPASERLVYVNNTFPKIGFASAGGISIPDYLDHHAGVKAFADSGMITGFNANLSLAGSPERVYGLTVTPSIFGVLQIPPALGRTFGENDAEPGAAKIVVLRDNFWRARFGADPKIIGQTIRLNGEPHEVIGVMPPGFYFPSQRAQFFVPYAFTAEQKSEAQRVSQPGVMIARLRADATLEQAQREVDAIHRARREQQPELQQEYAATGYGSTIAGFLETNVQDVRGMLWLLQGAAAAALLIGCANIANLLLARASAREREFAIRSALGAGRGRLIRQLLAESVLLFLAGGALGLIVALWGLSAVNSLGVGDLPRSFGVTLDAPVFGFTFGGALLTGLAFGSLPAWSSTRGNAIDALKSGARGSTATRRQLGLRSALVVAQIALSLMLLATAGLLLKSFARLQAESPGFAADQTLSAQLTLPAAKYGTPEKRAAFVAALTAHVEALPGVSAAGVVNAVPFGGPNPHGAYQIEGRANPSGQPNPNGRIRRASAGYFAAQGIPLLQGRTLAPADTLGREPVAVVDRLFVEKYFPHTDPIGQRVRRMGAPDGPWSTIVGVVGTVKHSELDETVLKETVYFAYAQDPLPTFSLLVRAERDAAALLPAVRQAVLALDPEQPVYDVKTMSARIAQSLQPQRAPMVLLGVFAGMAALLAALGIYGVLAFSVGQRTNEIGIRMALGADRSSILGLVLGQGARLVVVGVAIGFGGYFAASRVVAQQLYRVAPTDPVTLFVAPLLLAGIAFLACLLPARRATNVDPMTALRAE